MAEAILAGANAEGVVKKNHTGETLAYDASLDFPCQNQGQGPFHQNSVLHPNLRIRNLFQCVFTEVFPETDDGISTTYIICP